jgi:hypothetical protein
MLDFSFSPSANNLKVHTGDIVYTGYRRDGLQPVRGEWVWRRFDAAVLLVEES